MNIICHRRHGNGQCRKPARRYAFTVAVVVEDDDVAGFNATLAQVAGGGSVHGTAQFCDRHADRFRRFVRGSLRPLP